MTTIGSNFAAELKAAGLSHVPVVWSPDGELSFGPLATDAERQAVQALISALDPLVGLKSDKNAEINAARAAANISTFAHDGNAFSCDPLSRSDIDGVNGYVALYGALPPAFPGAWKAADNSYYLIADVAAWKAFYASMVATGAANFMHAQTLKIQLAAATTPEAVAAIVW